MKLTEEYTALAQHKRAEAESSFDQRETQILTELNGKTVDIIFYTYSLANNPTYEAQFHELKPTFFQKGHYILRAAGFLRSSDTEWLDKLTPPRVWVDACLKPRNKAFITSDFIHFSADDNDKAGNMAMMLNKFGKEAVAIIIVKVRGTVKVSREGEKWSYRGNYSWSVSITDARTVGEPKILYSP